MIEQEDNNGCNPQTIKRLNIIGCGRAAGSLAKLWVELGLPAIGQLLNRTPQSTAAAARELRSGEAAVSIGQMAPADCWLIGTPDQQIAGVAEELAAAGRGLENALVFHLAGRFGTEVLAPLRERDCLLAAVHPVRSLTHETLELADFAGTACVAEGDALALKRLEPLIVAIGGAWLPVQNIDRGLYHAALSIVSNVTKGVAWKAQNWLQSSGLPAPTAVAITQQLLATTVEDIARSGAKQSITGPVVRGDTSTVVAHLGALQNGPAADVDLYQVLARVVLELAVERGDLDEKTLRDFERLLYF